MVRGQMMKAIEEAIARLEAERARIDGKIEGLREAIRLQAGGGNNIPEASERKRARRGNLKESVLDLAKTVGDRGLTADECVTMARETKGIELVPASVSSLLSRLKNDGVVFFDGERYRLKQYAGPRNAA
jgi:hypothetical protein